MRDGEIDTACEMACPSEAIVFGDSSDSKSVVGVEVGTANYGLLEELNTMPRTTYLAACGIPTRNLNKSEPS